MVAEAFVAVVVSLALSGMLAGLCWTVQIVVYPQFGNVPAASFVGYHAAHTRGITLVVAPLMLAELALALWLVIVPGVDPRVAWALLGLTAVIWASTAMVQVPLHARLERDGQTTEAVRRLVRSNWVRTLAWTARVVLLAWISVDATISR